MTTRLRFLHPQATRVSRLHDVGAGASPPSFWTSVRGDYHRHGSTIFNAGFMALFVYRFGRWADKRQMLWSRIAAQKVYGLIHAIISTLHRVWIPAEATLGEGFHIIHVEGSISLHPRVVIGKRCGIMHNVTIGTNMTAGAPQIGDDVFIGVNSCILGDIRIGDRVRIGANTAVTMDVPSDSIVVGSPAKIYPRLGPFVREDNPDDA